jgi:hypothetical protein
MILPAVLTRRMGLPLEHPNLATAVELQATRRGHTMSFHGRSVSRSRSTQ